MNCWLFSLRWMGRVAWLLAGLLQSAQAAPSPEENRLLQAMGDRDRGQVSTALTTLRSLSSISDSLEWQARVVGETGITQLHAGQLEQAEQNLQQAVRILAPSTVRTRYQGFLASVQAVRGHVQGAQETFSEALRSPAMTPAERMSLRLLQIRWLPESLKAQQLLELAQQSDPLLGLTLDPAWRLNLAQELTGIGPMHLEAAWKQIENVLQGALAAGDVYWIAEARQAMAGLYESSGRLDEALQINQQAIRDLELLAPARAGELRILVESRQARLLKAKGQPALALAAAERAVDQIELIRQDLPIVRPDGRSVFSSFLEPQYLMLADLLLLQSEGLPTDQAAPLLGRVLQVLEWLRQAEMQDFLGDRCALDADVPSRRLTGQKGTAIVHTLVLQDRVELLMLSPEGVIRKSSPVGRDQLRQMVLALTERLREGLPQHQRLSQPLHRWLLAPLEPELRRLDLKQLVMVPDGSLRLLPFAALFDGQSYAIEKYAISIVTGLSMTSTSALPSGNARVLIAGVSLPGTVVEQLPLEAVDQMEGKDSSTDGTLVQRRVRGMVAGQVLGATQIEQLRQELALPGVEREVKALTELTRGLSLLNEQFTVAGWKKWAESGEFRIMHIASHGWFGGAAETSFIMAHDQVLHTQALQAMLQSPALQKNPIDLLTLSACQTAEGNDRAPLGISGVAMRARARSVLGTLWPVADEAARQFMIDFYRGLRERGLAKTQALREAQIQMLRQPGMAHPLFWSPFTLIGQWQ